MNYIPDDERPDIVHFKCPFSGQETSLVAGNYPPNSMNACVMVYVGRNPSPFIVPVDAVVDVWNSFSRWRDSSADKEPEGTDNPLWIEPSSWDYWNEQLEKLDFEKGENNK